MCDENCDIKEMMINYVLLSHGEYQASIKALQAIDIISEVLDHAPEQAIPTMIRMVLGKEVTE